MFSQTNSDNIAVFLVQLSIINIERNAKWNLSEFGDKWSGIFSQRMPGRKSVEKDGGGESQPEKAKHIASRLNDIDSIGEIEHY